MNSCLVSINQNNVAGLLIFSRILLFLGITLVRWLATDGASLISYLPDAPRFPTMQRVMSE